MKDHFVSDLEPNQNITTTFLVKDKEVRTAKNGNSYLSLTLGDKSGSLDAKMWDNVAEVEPTFGRDDFVKVKGQVRLFNNKQQLTIHRIRRCQESEVDLGDYLPRTTRDVERMFGDLLALVSRIGNPHLGKLLENLLNDSEFTAKFKQAPAAKSLHHAWLGGLLEHTLSLCRLCQGMAEHYPELDLDLLLTGAVLHDVGKTEELSYSRSFAYTTEGQLLGHMILELDLVNRKMAEIEDFPPRLKTLVQHLIISHHGEYEFGSPKLPMFPESLVLHYLDNLDSKLTSMLDLIAGDTNADPEWTAYNRMFERPLFKDSKIK
jgi:3'-5' exoribonuclease